jgi:hypothetical protein
MKGSTILVVVVIAAIVAVALISSQGSDLNVDWRKLVNRAQSGGWN